MEKQFKQNMHYVSDVSTKASIAGISCAITSTILNPIDVTKIRMQNQSNVTERIYKTLSQSAFKILHDEGIRGWGRGLTASIYRELVYSSIRIGAYEPIRYALYDMTGTTSSPVVKFGSALLSGFVGSFAANPFDLIKTRFQAILPPLSPHIVSTKEHPISISTISALKEILHSHGVKGLYKGWQVTTLRAAILTSAQLGSYDTIKNNLLIDIFRLEDGLVLHFWASLVAGIITTTAANPVDVVKTRYLADTTHAYRSPMHCAATVFKLDGIAGFFKGWTPAYWRIGPHTIISFILIEKIRGMFGLSAI